MKVYVCMENTDYFQVGGPRPVAVFDSKDKMEAWAASETPKTHSGGQRSRYVLTFELNAVPKD